MVVRPKVVVSIVGCDLVIDADRLYDLEVNDVGSSGHEGAVGVAIVLVLFVYVLETMLSTLEYVLAPDFSLFFNP